MRNLTILFTLFVSFSASAGDFIPWPKFRAELERQAEDVPNYQYLSGRVLAISLQEKIEAERARINQCLYEQHAAGGESEDLVDLSMEYHVGSTMLEYLIEWTQDEQPDCRSLRHDIKYSANYRPNLMNSNADFTLRIAEKICRLDSARPLEHTLSTMDPEYLEIEFANRRARNGEVFPEFLTKEVIDAARDGDRDSLTLIESIQSERFGEAILQLVLHKVGPDNFLDMLDALQRSGSAGIWEQAIEDLGRRSQYSAGGFEGPYLQHYKPGEPELDVRFAFLMAWLHGYGGFWSEWMNRAVNGSFDTIVANPRTLTQALENGTTVFTILNESDIGDEEAAFVMNAVPIAQLEQLMAAVRPEELKPSLVDLTCEIVQARGLKMPDLWCTSAFNL